MNRTVPAVAPFPQFMLKQKWIQLIAYILLWSIPGIAALSFYFLNQTLNVAPIDWNFALVSTLPTWYIWALLAPLLAFIVKRYPIEDTPWAKLVFGIHLPMLVAMMLIHSALNLVLFWAAGLHSTITPALYELHFTSRFLGNFFTFIALICLIYSFQYFWKYSAGQRRAARLQAQLAEANLMALKMQVHPHFLFNTLHSIAALVRKSENTLAVDMLGQFGEFLRIALDNDGLHEVPLRKELEFLERYLCIEKIRFEERLTVNIHVPDFIKDYYVPNLILQPIVENAIHHGIAPFASDGQIDVTAVEKDGLICISVRDNGPRIVRDGRPVDGSGFDSTRERLKSLYGEYQEFSLHNSQRGGLEVRICIPQTREPTLISVAEGI